MDYREANARSNTFLIIAMVLFIGCLLIQNWIVQMLCLIGGIVLIVLAIVLRVKYSKCPYCKKKLPLGFRSEPDKCPHCKETIIKNESEK
ncbi:MAG: hypothetical protein IJ397_04330 [Lachnospiraceae bacterium]|nr:hypothetical protein [Lachnospiraceae bacterium]